MKKEDYENSSLDKQYFDKYIEELYNINSENPKRANDIAKRGLDDLGLLNESNKNFLGIDIEWAIIVGICILIALGGFFAPNIKLGFSYIGGLVFFFAGVFIGLDIPLFGLIFLFTHGGVGLCLMIMSLIGGDDLFEFPNITNNPVFSDGGMPLNLRMYLSITITILVIAVLYTIIHNLSPRLKENKKHMIIIMTIYLVFIVLVGLITRFFPYLITQ